MSYPYQNPPQSYPGSGNPPYPGSGNPPYPGIYPPAPGQYPSPGNSSYPAVSGGSPYPLHGASNVPYPMNPPPAGYNPTMGSTPYLPPGYTTFGYTANVPYPQQTTNAPYAQPTNNVHYPPQKTNVPYPQQTTNAPYAQPTTNVHYPPQKTNVTYPSQKTNVPCPPQKTSVPYSPQQIGGTSGPRPAFHPYSPQNPSASTGYPQTLASFGGITGSINQTFSKESPQLNSFQGTSNINMAYYVEGQGTVLPFPGFDPKEDAQTLRAAMKGFGTDEKAIIGVLARRSNAQRVYIGVEFKQLYGKDLIDDLKSELSGRFEDVILALMTPLTTYLAKEVHSALSGIGTDEDTLVEILCSRTNREIWEINGAYQRLYGKDLEQDIRGDTSGHFRRLLVSVCTGARHEGPADPAQARQDAQAIYQAGAGQWGTDESVFNSILCAQSYQQLSLVFYEYHQLTGTTIVKAIESEMSGDVQKGMLAIARSVENRQSYFAEKLYKAMKGLGTDDRTLIRIVVSRCEIDMVQIKEEYERAYGKALQAAIADDTSGDYKRVLIALISG